jgi:hypothetical protein
MRPSKLPTATERAEGMEYMKKKIINVKNIKKDFKDPDLLSYGKKMPIVNKAVMKAGLNTTKILDSKVGKGMVKVGNAVKKGATAPLKWAGNQVAKEMKIDKAKDDIYRAEGQALNRSYSGLPNNVKVKK